MKFLRDQRGQATIVIGLGIACLCGMAGFAVDVGSLFHVKRELQTAADAGAIAGAQEINYSDVTTAADAATAQNGMTNGSNGVTVTVNNPPKSGPHSGSSAYVEVIVTESAPTFFMKLFRLSSVNVSARSVAGLGPGSGCIYTLDPSGIDIGLTGTGTLDMPDCGIVINSASSNGLNMTGTSTVQALSIGIVGSYHTTGSTTLLPTPVTGVAPAPDPLAYMTPPPFASSSCLANPGITGSGSTITIGPSLSGGTVCYNGLSISGSNTIVMTPGLYIINGSFSFTGSGSISGSGVTIYLAPPNGALSLTGSGSLNLTAPTTGTWDGVLFYEDPNDSNSMKITGSTGSNLQGIFYAPDASLNLTGSSGATIYADLVVHALSMTGTTTLKNYSDVNSSEPLTSARLVE